MKKIIFSLMALMCTLSINAQVIKVMKGNTVVDTYTIDQADNVVFEKAAQTDAAWESALSLGKSTATSIVIETGVTTLPSAEDDTHKKLNAAGDLWEVLDGTTLKIQTSLSNIKGRNPLTITDGLFRGYTSVTSITGLDKIDFSEVTSMKYMFLDCKALTSLDLSSFNTSNVTSMESMFENCEKISTFTLSNNFVMTNVTNTIGMFRKCGKSAPGDKCWVYGVTDSAIRTALSKDDTQWGDGYMRFAD